MQTIQAAIEGDPRSLQILEAHLVDMLRADHSEAPCPPCAVAAKTVLLVFYQGPSSKHHGRAPKSYPDILRSCLHFITRPRTSRELAALVEARDCYCDKHEPVTDALHNCSELVFPETSESTIEAFAALSLPAAICEVLYFALNHESQNGLSSKLIKSANRRLTSESPWPSSQQDLLPFRLHTIQGISRWREVTSGRYILKLVCLIYTVVTDGLIPSLFLRIIVPY